MGIVIHPKGDWPRPVYPRFVKYGPSKPGFQLHTTQRYVYVDLVNDKIKEIKDGATPAVSTVWAGGARWVFDGHHTLAAYLLLGVEPKLARYDNGGSDSVPAPHLFRRTP